MFKLLHIRVVCMEMLGIVLMLLTVFGAFIGVVSLIVLLIMILSKINLKKPGIITGSAFGVALLAFVGFIILVIVDPPDDTTTAKNNYPRSSYDANSSDNDTTYTKPNQNVDRTQYNEETDDNEFDKNLKGIREEKKENEYQDKRNSLKTFFSINQSRNLYIM